MRFRNYYEQNVRGKISLFLKAAMLAACIWAFFVAKDVGSVVGVIAPMAIFDTALTLDLKKSIEKMVEYADNYGAAADEEIAELEAKIRELENGRFV